MLCCASLSLPALAAGTADGREPVDYVNPFIGCAANGHTFPGACTPFGMVQTSPVTGAVGWQYCAEYLYSDKRIWGFTQTHLNGTGCVELGDILVMPSTARPGRIDYRSSFDKKSEEAHPGYYKVYLDETGVQAELTATPHVAFHRYTFQRADSAAVLVDLQHAPTWNERQYHSSVTACEVNWEDSRTLSGHVRGKMWVDQDVYFVMTFDRPMRRVADLPLSDTERGRRMLVSFDMKPGETLQAKISISSATVDGARRNMAAELPGWDFEATRSAASKGWNEWLSRFSVEGTEDEKTNFYTSFYHAPTP